MELRFPWDSDPAAVEAPTPAPQTPPRPKRGRRPAAAPVTPPATAGWLYHHLTISGPATPLAAFADAARGAGVIPWQLDGGLLEEDIFHLAASQPARMRSLTIEGCRILARQFRERVETRQAKAAALIGRSQACPFDLQALLPVPAAILRLGPNHPTALAWLAENWGTTDGLRQTVARPRPTLGRRLPAGHSVVGYGFFTAGDTPHAGIAQLGGRWPALRFRLERRPAR